MTELQKTGDVFHIMLVYQKKMGSLFDEELAVADSNGFWFHSGFAVHCQVDREKKSREN
jgi:hypothetical protein